MDLNIGPFILLALSIGFFHTLLGPDHYLPFIALSKAKKWTLKKTLLVTFLCGLGHVLSSVILGFFGIGFGWAIGELIAVENFRSDFAAWLLLSFGVLYMVWGLRQALRKTQTDFQNNHSHAHNHLPHFHTIDPITSDHHSMDKPHNHEGRHHHFFGKWIFKLLKIREKNSKNKDAHPDHQHPHAHPTEKDSSSHSPWILFLIFVFGPCEPLIPVLMFPAIQKDTTTLVMVVLSFTLVTLLTMLSVVAMVYRGLSYIKLSFFDQWTHAMAGASIMLVASGMILWGW